jgi:putative PIN family toxin of toxin-antitoxin system
VKIFFDTNVWISALVARGLCADLLRMSLNLVVVGRLEIHTCPAVQSEIRRILTQKLRASEIILEHVETIGHLLRSVPDRPVWPGAEAVADIDDRPILGAALDAGVDLFVTGDALLLGLTELPTGWLVNPRIAFERISALAS